MWLAYLLRKMYSARRIDVCLIIADLIFLGQQWRDFLSVHHSKHIARDRPLQQRQQLTLNCGLASSGGDWFKEKTSTVN